jgi:hypothetical protein
MILTVKSAPSCSSSRTRAAAQRLRLKHTDRYDPPDYKVERTFDELQSHDVD